MVFASLGRIRCTYYLNSQARRSQHYTASVMHLKLFFLLQFFFLQFLFLPQILIAVDNSSDANNTGSGCFLADYNYTKDNKVEKYVCVSLINQSLLISLRSWLIFDCSDTYYKNQTNHTDTVDVLFLKQESVFDMSLVRNGEK